MSRCSILRARCLSMLHFNTATWRSVLAVDPSSSELIWRICVFIAISVPWIKARCTTFVGTAIRSGPGRLPLPWNVGVQSAIPSIRDADMINLNGLDVPSRRACPTCGNVVEHNQEGCKFIVCPRCKKEFCFLCLLLKEKCLELLNKSWFKSCKNPVAPKQTVIPVWSQAAWILCYGFIYLWCVVIIIIYSL